MVKLPLTFKPLKSLKWHPNMASQHGNVCSPAYPPPSSLSLSSEKDWSEEDRGREQELMADLVTIIEQRNQIINNMDQDRQRWVSPIAS